MVSSSGSTEVTESDVREQFALDPVLAREIEYHERLYSGFAQKHFARPAVRAFRADLVAHMRKVSGIGPSSRVLSIGCGIGDTELLLAPHVREIVGVDLSPSAIKQARQGAIEGAINNATFFEGTIDSVDLPEKSFDLVCGVFFLHHLSDRMLQRIPSQAARLLVKGGQFYGLDPSNLRLSGAMGALLCPRLMRRHQSPDEKELDAARVAALFATSGFDCRSFMYDFISTPLSGLAPGWSAGYRAARVLDEVLIRTPLLSRLGSNFELIAKLW